MSAPEPSRAETAAAAATVPLSPVHDFAAKLRQPGLKPRLEDYVRWRRALREAEDRGEAAPAMPGWAPLSINLDLTTACNYACEHCIDWETLNSGVSYDDLRLKASLEEMARRGLKSVILIGGGEPTVHPAFADVVRHLKDLGLQVAVVSNGSRNARLHEVMERFDEKDWIRLSLDAGTDATFQAMHRPKKPVSLAEICSWIPRLKAKNAAPRIGFSFIITWEGADRGPGAPPLKENLGEMAAAARLARDSGFDYISFKPVLTRGPEGAEVLDPTAARERLEGVLQRIEAQLNEASALASPTFAVVESTNLKALAAGTWRAWSDQPRTCHMQAFRQVLSPLGLWNCPAHRGVGKARIAGRDAYADAASADQTAAATSGILARFDASRECREVTCLYHATNWWIEAAIEDPRVLATAPAPEGEDYFL